MYCITTVLIFICGLAAASPASHYRRNESDNRSFAGSNLYFLHALPEDVQTNYISTLASWGVQVVRLWVTGSGDGCEKGSATIAIPQLEPDVVGTYNTTVLTALDNTLSVLHSYGIKAIISPHDAGVVNGSNGCDVYCNKYGDQATFYTSSEAWTDYSNRLETILTFESPNFGIQWGQLDNVILAFDIQNEPMINALDLLNANDPNDWLCGHAGFMKGLISTYSAVKVATGGIGGSQYCCDHEYNLLSKALYCDAIDIMSVHGYMNKASDWAYFVTGDASVLDVVSGSPGKSVMIEEWGVSESSEDGFDAQVEVFNDAGIPWLYWQVIPGLDQTQSGAPTECGYDGFEIGLDSAKGNVESAVHAASGASAASAWVT